MRNTYWALPYLQVRRCNQKDLGPGGVKLCPGRGSQHLNVLSHRYWELRNMRGWFFQDGGWYGQGGFWRGSDSGTEREEQEGDQEE